MKKIGLVCFVILNFIIARDVSALPEIRDCETEFYDITGENGTELLMEMQKKNEITDGYFGSTKYAYKSKCGKLSLTCTVRLPRWTEFDSSINQVLKEKWEKFYVALVALHQGHVDIFNTHMNAASPETDLTDCQSATQRVKSKFREMSEAQKKYSAETDHGLKTGATFAGANFQTIVYSQKTGAVGFAFDQETREVAKSSSLADCKAKDCKLVQWVNGDDSCLSLAVSSEKIYCAAYGNGQEEAEEKTLAACSTRGKNCKIRITVCAGKGKVSE